MSIDTLRPLFDTNAMVSFKGGPLNNLKIGKLQSLFTLTFTWVFNFGQIPHVCEVSNTRAETMISKYLEADSYVTPAGI